MTCMYLVREGSTKRVIIGTDEGLRYHKKMCPNASFEKIYIGAELFDEHEYMDQLDIETFIRSYFPEPF